MEEHEFKITALLGRGGFGKVYEVEGSTSKKLYALKVALNEKSQGIHNSVITEIEILQNLDHPNIIKLLSIIDFDDEPAFVMELCYCDLDRFVEQTRKRPSTEFPLMRLTRQLLEATAHVHSRGFVHGDIRPQNILLMDDGNLKLCDFGKGFRFTIPCSKVIDNCDPSFNSPPETLYGEEICGPVHDSWAIGYCVIFMRTKEYPFDGKEREDLIRSIERVFGSLDESKWPENISMQHHNPHRPKKEGKGFSAVYKGMDFLENESDFLFSIMAFNPMDRWTPKKALTHPFVIQ